ncbi:MAG: insulinase family protein, partial [Eubacterium sp.]|nr:insulinase family protein [Eubacterium sp.]
INYLASPDQTEGFDDLIKNGREQHEALKAQLYTDEAETGSFVWAPENRKEGFKTSGQVQYVGIGGNFREAGFDYTAALSILKTILNYEYLWINIRVMGGAYGCMSSFRRSGNCYLVSYRDPNLKETLDVFEKLPAFLENFHVDEREMTKYIIGTISEIDTPMTAQGKGSAALHAWMGGLTEADYQKSRDQVLDADDSVIRGLKDLIAAVIAQKRICVVGSAGQIEKNEGLFEHTESLIKG